MGEPGALTATLASEVLATIRPDETTGAASTLEVYEQVLAEQERARASDLEAFEIVSPLGKGGMGEVFLAVQRSLGRDVALKQSTRDDPRAVAAFVSEARVTARLAHANIVPVYTLGRGESGRPVLSMKRVEGTSWSRVLDTEPPLEENLRVLLAVCNAVAFAHEVGFIHRDLKPENVMVSSHGQVFVVDWGVAAGLDRATCDAHAILHVEDVKAPTGTPAYMAPELARGDGKAQGPVTDVFLLGALLHEILTGDPPNAGPTVRDCLAQAIERADPDLGDAPPELARICRKALAKDPANRYATVGAFSEAIVTFTRHAAARTITEKGVLALGRLDAERAAYRTAPAAQREAKSRLVHRAYNEATFAFDVALESLGLDGPKSRTSVAEDAEASLGMRRADAAMLAHALDAEDLPLATRLVDAVDDPELARGVAALRAKVEAREAELQRLREEASLLDVRRANRPVSRVFLIAGIAGGAATFPTPHLVATGNLLGLWGVWGSVAVLSGAIAWFTVRRSLRSLVSPRVAWTWAAIGIGCVSGGIISTLQHQPPFSNVSYVAFLIAIGFVSHAVQTKRWLVAPAVALYAGAILMAAVPEHRVAIFGALWFVTLTAVGVGLRRG